MPHTAMRAPTLAWRAQGFVQVDAAVVEGGVERAALQQEVHLARAAGRADHARAGALGKLPRQLAHGAGRRRDVDRVTR
jgi:hypothetical protein